MKRTQLADNTDIAVVGLDAFAQNEDAELWIRAAGYDCGVR